MQSITVLGLAAVVVLATESMGAELRVPSEYAALQLAIDAAVDGDTILVEPGTYAGPFTVPAKAITIRATTGPLDTTLSGEGTHRVITLIGAPAGCVLEGFTIAEGAHSDYRGAGGVTSLNSSAAIRNCRFYRNRSLGCYPSSAWGGAAFYGEGGAPVIERCAFVENSAAYSGSGIYQYLHGSITIRDCDFSANGTGGYGVGGSPCNPVDGGVIHLQNEGGAVSGLIERCRFTGNIGCDSMAVGTWSPGGVMNLTVTDCIVASPQFASVPGGQGTFQRSPVVLCSFGQPSNSVVVTNLAVCGYPSAVYSDAGYSIQATGIATSAECSSPDIDGDEITTAMELTYVLSHWGNWGTGQPADFNADGLVDGSDLTLVLGHWQ
jgi:hypothetical protein